MQWTRHASSAPAPTELPVRSDHERITTSKYCGPDIKSQSSTRLSGSETLVLYDVTL